jgi:outer membrane protein TolC
MTPAQASGKLTAGKPPSQRTMLLRGQWWEMFHEPELNAFESQVNASNQTVAAALANFLAARAVVKQSRSQYFPTVTANPSVTRSRQASHLKTIQLIIVSFNFYRICAAL